MSIEKELVGKIQTLMRERFGGTGADSRRRLFDAYDGDQNGQISGDELSHLLADAHVGNGLTRGFWVKGVLHRLDADKSGTISYLEFEGILEGS